MELKQLAALCEYKRGNEIVEGMSTPEMVSFARTCTSYAAQLAYLAEYADNRANGASDEKARTAADKGQKRVRRALGYSYP